MAVRPRKPNQGNITVTTVVLVLAGWFAAPVLAAPDRGGLPCHKNEEATLEIARHELTVAPVSHENSDKEESETSAARFNSVSEHHLLKPRVEATAREVFADSVSDTESEEAVEDDTEEHPATEPRLRPISDSSQTVPSRRQMYRKDI